MPNPRPSSRWFSLLSAILAIAPVVLSAWGSEDSEEPSVVTVRPDVGRGNLTIGLHVPGTFESIEPKVE